MRRLSLILVVLIAAGCASTALPTRPNDREWNALSTEYARIETLRRSATEASPQSDRKKRIEAQLQLWLKLEPSYSTFIDQLKEYFVRTSDPRASRIYVTEKIRMADEYADLLSRYDRAINLYHAALQVDPSNETARRKLAEAEAKRFIAFDTFSAVKPGMSEAAVRSSIGMPREDWIKQVIQKNRAYSVWIYPKPAGGAAAIYFENGVVYHTNWNAAPDRPKTHREGEK